MVDSPTVLNYTSHLRRGDFKTLNEWGIETTTDMVLEMALYFESGLENMGISFWMKNPPQASLSSGVSITPVMLFALKLSCLCIGRDGGLIDFEGAYYLEFSDPSVSSFQSLIYNAGNQR
jgi:hypothetical protein